MMIQNEILKNFTSSSDKYAESEGTVNYSIYSQ